MAFFLVTMTHSNLEGWTRFLQPHIAFLRDILEEGPLRASGPLTDAEVRAGFLVITASSRADVEAIISRDPFAREGLIDQLVIQEWDPLFGVFASESSGVIPQIGE